MSVMQFVNTAMRSRALWTRGLSAVVAGGMLVVTGCSEQVPATESDTGIGTNQSSPAVSGAEFSIPCSVTTAKARAAAVAALPDDEFDCLGGGPRVSLAQFRGRPLIVHIWASWCQVCRQDMPAVLAAHAQLPGRIQFIGVDWKDDGASARGYAAAAKLTFPSIVDPKGSVGALWGVKVQPATVFIRSNGTIAHIHSGAFTTASALLDAAKEFLQ
ncbi:MAG: hypothetical protein RL745_752 [Actinomycetota bacterium]|jgi:thiol-disulfide isomerase/thioredoxin